MMKTCKSCKYQQVKYSPILHALVETCIADINRGEGCKNIRRNKYAIIQKSEQSII